MPGILPQKSGSGDSDVGDSDHTKHLSIVVSVARMVHSWRRPLLRIERNKFKVRKGSSMTGRSTDSKISAKSMIVLFDGMSPPTVTSSEVCNLAS